MQQEAESSNFPKDHRKKKNNLNLFSLFLIILTDNHTTGFDQETLLSKL